MKNLLFAVILLGFIFPSCNDDYYADGGLADGKLNMTTYDFIKSRPDMFEKLIWIIDQNNLKETINKEGSTFFPPKDESIVAYLERKQLESVQLDKLPQVEIDTLGMTLEMYMFPYVIMRDDLSPKMKEYVSISDHLMGITLKIEPYNEIPGFGPSTVILSGPLRFNPGSSQGIRANAEVATSNLESANGAIHVLRHTGHIFGF
jgi:hypothetical protein